MGWELDCIKWGHEWWSTGFLDQTLPYLTHLGSHYAVILFTLLAWALTRKKRVFGHLVLLYALLSTITYGLKFLIQRERPLSFLDTPSPFARGIGEVLDPSFPSAHTLFAFMMATLLSAWLPRYRLIFYLMAGLVGWTRVYLGMHYPTDVIAGGLLGYGITRLFLHRRRGSIGRETLY